MYMGGPGRSTNPPVLLSLPWLPRRRGMGMVIDAVADLATVPPVAEAGAAVDDVAPAATAFRDAAAATEEDMERAGALAPFEGGDAERARAACGTLPVAPGDVDGWVVAPPRIAEKRLNRLNAGRACWDWESMIKGG